MTVLLDLNAWVSQAGKFYYYVSPDVQSGSCRQCEKINAGRSCVLSQGARRYGVAVTFLRIERLSLDQMELSQVWLNAEPLDVKQVLVALTSMRVAFHAEVGDNADERTGLLAEIVCAA